MSCDLVTSIDNYLSLLKEAFDSMEKFFNAIPRSKRAASNQRKAARQKARGK